LLHLVLESHGGRALVPIPKRSASPRPDVDAAAVVSLKVLDPNRPIREADIVQHDPHVREVPEADFGSIPRHDARIL
jgi:hypothetical protein